MPRKKREVWLLKSWDEPMVGLVYLVLILHAGCRNGKAWVKWRHLDKDQAGRTREVYLELPIRPEGLAIEFCNACNLIPDADQSFDPARAQRKTIRVIFGRSASGAIEPEVFTAVVEEQANDCRRRREHAVNPPVCLCG